MFPVLKAMFILGLFNLMHTLGTESFTGKNSDARPSAICIVHIGSSDKPIFPLIIAVDQKAGQRCKELLGSEAQNVALYVVSGVELAEMRTRSAHLLRAAEESDDNKAYGTFKITIVNSEHEQFILARKTAVSFIEIIRKVSQNRELTERLHSLERRLGGSARNG